MSLLSSFKFEYNACFQVWCFGCWSTYFSLEKESGLAVYYSRVRFYENGQLVGETF